MVVESPQTINPPMPWYEDMLMVFETKGIYLGLEDVFSFFHNDFHHPQPSYSYKYDNDCRYYKEF